MSERAIVIDPMAPYCGLPPAPADLAAAWNGDWRLLLALAVLACAVLLSPRRRLFMAGWLTLVVAFVSPLCALTVALFAARSVHHLLLLTVAAPLLGAALPQLGRRVPAGMALLATAVVLTLWHVPAVYSWAWQSHGAYAFMQVALLVPATLFWAAVLITLTNPQAVHASAIVGGLAQIAALAGVMGLIGAVLTFAPEALYAEHGLAPLAYGLQPLEDQQLGGLLMWAPGLLPLALIAAALLRQAWQRAAQAAEVAAS